MRNDPLLRAAFPQNFIPGYLGVESGAHSTEARIIDGMLQTFESVEERNEFIENAKKQLHLHFPCTVIFHSEKNEERVRVEDWADLEVTVREGPTRELEKEGYRISLDQGVV